MDITKVDMPNISPRFYEELENRFPRVSGTSINRNTDIIDLHRQAAQEEVLDYIGRHTTKRNNNTRSTIWSRLKFILFNK